VECNLSEDIATFKTQIYTLTNVPVEKQKVMIKGKMLKDDTEWDKYPGIKEGCQLLLMGTAEGQELKNPDK